MPRRRKSRIREAYGEHFSESAVTYPRVMNAVERRTAVTRPAQDYDREFEYETNQYSGIRSYHDDDHRGYRSDSIHTGSVRGYHGDSRPIGSIRVRNSPPPRQEDYRGPYYRGSRDDSLMGRQGEMRISSRADSHLSSGVQGIAPLSRTMSPAANPDRVDSNLMQALMYLDRGEDPEGLRRRGPGPYPVGPAGDTYTTVRDRSPIRMDIPPGPVLMRSGSNTNRRSYSPDRDQKSFSYQQSQQKRYNEEPHSQNREPDKPRLLSHTRSASLDGSPHSYVAIKEERVPTPALLAGPKETVSAKEEKEQTQEDNFKTRRSQAIAAKALEIEKRYKQDCETFGTVVKMLVIKEPVWRRCSRTL
ncbi:periphilin-1 isoform X1 [Coregonus clupeaformis]|uniref:periphilin-1 isoform X1 n=2 Tax=Coregonus clupeaformis TaxID=59861 RepID=UPI001E1C5CDB|nr:periphilin-1 isoform X1 [Coregonus clupeaformis]